MRMHKALPAKDLVRFKLDFGFLGAANPIIALGRSTLKIKGVISIREFCVTSVNTLKGVCPC